MSGLTGSQKVAKMVLGYLPKGCVGVVERCNSGARYRVGEIVVNGKRFCSIPASLNGGQLPQPPL